jgi:hypothetical protein
MELFYSPHHNQIIPFEEGSVSWKPEELEFSSCKTEHPHYSHIATKGILFHLLTLEVLVVATGKQEGLEAFWDNNMGLVVNHPHNPHSHHPEVRYAHPAGHQERDPQVYNPNDT